MYGHSGAPGLYGRLESASPWGCGGAWPQGWLTKAAAVQGALCLDTVVFRACVGRLESAGLEALGEVDCGGAAGLAWLALLEGGLLDPVLQLVFVSAGI